MKVVRMQNSHRAFLGIAGLSIVVAAGLGVLPFPLPGTWAPVSAAADPSATSLETTGSSEYPAATPESQGIPAEALGKLADAVREYLEDGQLVGGELLVIKNRRTILHETFGYGDREAERAWEPNTICNIRSMTKPLTGAAAEILIDEGRLAPDDRVADYLPGFDTDESREITIEQILTHTSGLPLTILSGSYDYEDLQAMAAEVGARGPQFAPGSKFWYSDAGTDVLGAVIEKITGVTLDRFVGERLLEPLGMQDTFYAFDQEDRRWGRLANLYIGSRGSWMCFFKPATSEPLYPFAWGSQTLYSTPMDYAHFLEMWLDAGVYRGTRILSEAAVERMLSPVSVMKMLGSDMRAPTGFAGTIPYYGRMSIQYVSEATGQTEVLSHSGSDGTYAWAWPEQDLMVLYFTQSRGAASGIRLEAAIDYLLIHPERESEEVPEKYRPYLGTYLANYAHFRNEEFEILYSHDGLTLDVPSQFPFKLRDADAEGRWYFDLIDEVYLTFETEGNGEVVGLKIHESGAVYDLPRGRAEPETEFDLGSVRKYVGLYDDDEETGDVEVLIQSGNLAVKVPGIGILELFPPDEEGRFCVRASPSIWLRFEENDAGEVVSMTVQLPDERKALPRITE